MTLMAPTTLLEQLLVFFTMMLTVVRVLLNIHPWLAGLSAARVASVIKDPISGVAPMPSLAVLLWAIMPSSVVHASFDFILTVAPGGVALLTPVVIWYCSRWMFAAAWEDVCSDGAELGYDATRPKAYTT